MNYLTIYICATILILIKNNMALKAITILIKPVYCILVIGMMGFEHGPIFCGVIYDDGVSQRGSLLN